MTGRPRIVVAHNRDFEGAEADPENRARADVRDIAEHIARVLEDEGLRASVLGVTDDVPAAVRAIREAGADAVFNLCESVHGDNRFEPLLPLLLDLEGIAYTGSTPFALSLALHKHAAKDVLCGRGIPTPEAVVVETPDAIDDVRLPFPLIVKPAREDASVGISGESVVHTRRTLERRVRHVLTHYQQPALCERYVEGREIYVSLLGRSGGRPQVFPFFEIDFTRMPPDRPRIVSFEGKWVEGSVDYVGTTPVRCTGLPVPVVRRVGDTALAAFEAIGLRDYARLDVRLAADGTPYVIDVNPNCDLSDLAGGYVKAAKAAGMSYNQLILRLCEMALGRRFHADTVPLAPRSRPAARGADGGRHVPARGGVVRAGAARGGARPG